MTQNIVYYDPEYFVYTSEHVDSSIAGTMFDKSQLVDIISHVFYIITHFLSTDVFD